MIKKYLIIFAILTTLLLVGCTDNSAEMKQKLINANSDIDSYVIDMKVTSLIKTTEGGVDTQVTMYMESEGEVDILKKEMGIEGNMKMTVSGQTMDLPTETYVMDGFIYTSTMDQWYKLKIDEGMWEKQDQVAKMNELVETGKIEVLPDETIEGKEYHVVKLIPDLEMIAKQALESMDMLPNMEEAIDFSDMIKEYTSYMYVNKETFYIERTKVEMKMVINPDNLKVEDNEDTAEITSISESYLYNINEPVSITLPQEAVDAPDMTSMMLG